MAFYNTIDNYSNFVISFTKAPLKDFPAFAKGYFRSAKREAECLFGAHFPDYEAYPIIFLYRHALELYLKGIIYNSALLSALKGTDALGMRLHNNHNLVQLAENVNKILLVLFPDNEFIKVTAETLSTITSEFSEIDPFSYAFRYPINKQGHYSTKQHQLLNLEAVYTNMNLLLDNLDTVSFRLQVETHHAEELYEIFGEIEAWLGQD